MMAGKLVQGDVREILVSLAAHWRRRQDWRSGSEGGSPGNVGGNVREPRGGKGLLVPLENEYPRPKREVPSPAIWSRSSRDVTAPVARSAALIVDRVPDERAPIRH